MATNPSLPPLLPVNVDGIPASMLDTPRWAPWRAVWNEKKEKYDQIPYRFDRVTAGLSNKTTKGWGRFDQAMTAYLQNPDKFAGVGYLMTGPHGLVAVDLDHCVVDGVMKPWAAEVVAKLDSYTELSPSGNGLRVMVAGEVDRDWMNHDVGIEVYAGHAPRFVTITGAKVSGSPPSVRTARSGAMDALAARYRKVQTAAEVEDLHLPALLGEDELPELEDIQLPPYARNFLLEGAEPGQDRSQALFACSIALNQSGLSRQEVLSILEANEHAMDVAMDHRRQDYDKALRYLWKEHCSAGAARAEGLRQLQLDEFEELESQLPQDRADGDYTTTAGGGVADDFEVLDAGEDFADLLGGAAAAKAAPAAKLPRFTPVSMTTFMDRQPASWIIKGVLPRSGLAVVYGASGSGKTFLTLDMVGAVARGVDWRGHKVVPGRVVVIVAEGASGFRSRLMAYCQFHGVDPAALDILVIPEAPNFLDKAHIKDLITAIKKAGPVSVVLVDTYARVMAGGNENDAKDTGMAVAHCDLLHRVTGALVVLVHHSGKDASKGARGSGALRAAADMELEVLQLRDYRVATVTKMKDGADNKDYAFKLHEVVLGEDDDGDSITSCVVEARDTQLRATVAPRRPLTDRQRMVMGVVQDAMDLTGEGVHYADLKQQAVDRIPLDPDAKADNRGRDVGRCIDALLASAHLADAGNSVLKIAD